MDHDKIICVCTRAHVCVCVYSIVLMIYTSGRDATHPNVLADDDTFRRHWLVLDVAFRVDAVVEREYVTPRSQPSVLPDDNTSTSTVNVAASVHRDALGELREWRRRESVRRLGF